MPPAVIPFIPVIAAGIGVAGGLITGNQAKKNNEKLIDSQNQNLSRVSEFAEQIATRVSRSEYDSQANADVNAALKDVFGAMASRGMGRSTAGLTAASGASAQIRSGYGQQYLKDRLSSLQTAGGMISGVASTPRMGYDSDPYAGFRSGLSGIGSAAAYYQANRPAAAAPAPGNLMPGASYGPSSYSGRSGGAYGGNYGSRYPYP